MCPNEADNAYLLLRFNRNISPLIDTRMALFFLLFCLGLNFALS